MSGSQNNNSKFILSIYKDERTVFRLKEIALVAGEDDFQSLNRKLNYYVKTGKLNNPRKGIYTKSGFSHLEMACTVYTPSYISLEYVLQKAGVLFQYDNTITSVSYLSRNLEIESQEYSYRKIKGEILVNTDGIIMQTNQVNMATPERAFLDLLYLSPGFYFDNLNPLNKELVFKLLQLYGKKALVQNAKKLFGYD
jgi:hypothetical protein